MTQPLATNSTAADGPRNLPRSRMVVACSGPLGIAVVLALGTLVTYSFNLAGYHREMWAAATIGLVAGLLAVLPLLVLMRRGVIAIVRLTMLATGLRIAFMLAGLILASGPGWKLSLTPLVLWVAACYMALLIAESGATAWVVRHG